MRVPSRHQDHRSIDRSEEKGVTTSVFEHEHSISFGNQIGLRIPSRTFYPSLRRIRTIETIQKDGNKVVSNVGHHPRHKEAKDKLEDLEGSANVIRTWTLNWMKRVWTKALDEDDRGRSLPVQSRVPNVNRVHAAAATMHNVNKTGISLVKMQSRQVHQQDANALAFDTESARQKWLQWITNWQTSTNFSSITLSQIVTTLTDQSWSCS
ncbi:MAG: hypothetical protein J3Q66DRAFT_445134 [Benniella sp.]|nr:MAG: hypothetical protein J3Q66DRAFT_445134 [Benniella sp.]